MKVNILPIVFLTLLSQTAFSDNNAGFLWYSKSVEKVMSSEYLVGERKRNMFAINEQNKTVKITHITERFDSVVDIADSHYLGYGSLCEPAYLPCGNELYHLWSSPIPEGNSYSAVIDGKAVNFSLLSDKRTEYGDLYYLGLGTVCGLRGKNCSK